LNKRIRLVLSVALAMILATATFALAHPEDDVFDDGVVNSSDDVHGHKHGQHGETTGHLPASDENVDLVSKLKLRNVVPEKIADVGVHKGFAYLGAWGVVTCKYNGVHVVNIKNPAAPREVAFIPSKEGSYPGEGVQALSISTSAFNGDILVTNNETCNEKTGFGGMNIYDVSRPSAPTPLAVGIGDDQNATGQGKKDSHEIHSVFAWDAGNRAYAVMVDNEETRDVDIMDITNPKVPKLIAEYDMVEDFDEAENLTQDGMTNEVWLHDMVVVNRGTTSNPKWVMILSYWDAGYIQIDVTNPRAATVLADSDYADPDPEAAESGLTVPPEGNGHQAEWTLNEDRIIATDEDFDPYKLSALDDEGEPFSGTMGIAVPQGTTLPNDLVYVGRACATLPAATGDQIALVERGDCFFTDKVGFVDAAGYKAMIVFNNEEGSSPNCMGLINMLIEGDIPSFFVGRDTGFDLMDQPYDDALCEDVNLATQPVLATPGTVFADAVTISSYFDGWGYVHLFDESDMSSLDTYAIPEAHDPAYASGYGDLSVHEVATSLVENDLAYYAYYSGGVRVTRIEGDELVEKGHFIDTGGSNFWGVQAFMHNNQEYFAASDRDHGLYIFQYTGD
jgi:hypothetical protein